MVVPGFTRRVGYYGRYNTGGHVRKERKFIDTGQLGATCTTASEGGLLIVPTIIAQGTGQSNRIGRKITVKSIHLRAWFHKLTAVSSRGDNNIRIICFFDRQCNGQLPALTDLLQQDSIRSFRNLVNSGRFGVLLDDWFEMNNIAGSSANVGGTDTFGMGRDKPYVWNKKIQFDMEYSGTTGAITEIRTYNIYFLVIAQTNEGAPTANRVTMNYECRLRYVG